MCSGEDNEEAIERMSTYTEAGDASGAVAVADEVGDLDLDEVGDLDFDSVSEYSNSKSYSSASVDSSDVSESDGDVSLVSTSRGSVMFKSEYEIAEEHFANLEERWLHETDPTKKENLKHAVTEAEIAFALRFRIYAEILTGNEQEDSIAKKKTRNRMRTRVKENRCIGLPVKGRAKRRHKTRKVLRSRVDPLTRHVVSWPILLQQNKEATHQDLIRLWRQLPRVRRRAKARWWEGGSMTWSQCVNRYCNFYDMSVLYVWFKKLPRAD